MPMDDYPEPYAIAVFGDPLHPGLVIHVGEPWPRAGYIHELIAGDVRKYKMREGGPPYIADYVAPGSESNFEQETEGSPGATGPQGAQGPEGPAGSAGEPGPGLNYRGVWAAGTTYTVLDTVRHNGASYMCRVQESIGMDPEIPGAPVHWGLIAEQGDAGPTGETGATGATGAQGLQGEKGDPGSPLPSREQTVLSTAALAASAGESGTVILAKGFRVIRLTTNRPARVRLYATEIQRDADIGRSELVDPVGNHGLVMEILTTTTVLTLDLSPVPQGYSFESPPTADIAYRVDNRDAVTGVVEATFTWQEQEA